jgi:hypothetical protein
MLEQKNDRSSENIPNDRETIAQRNQSGEALQKSYELRCSTQSAIAGCPAYAKIQPDQNRSKPFLLKP